MAPWLFAPDTPDEAFKQLRVLLEQEQLVGNAELLTADESSGFISARLRYTMAGVPSPRPSW
jgi:hypothetical protein